MAACHSSLLELSCTLYQCHICSAYAYAYSDVYMTIRPQQLVDTAAKSDEVWRNVTTVEVDVQKASLLNAISPFVTDCSQ